LRQRRAPPRLALGDFRRRLRDPFSDHAP
jgi:hypothetical protein